jgi:ACT domain-containing protein
VVAAPDSAEELNTAAKVAIARVLHADKWHSVEEICKSVGVSRATLYRYLDVPTPPDAQPTDR